MTRVISRIWLGPDPMPEEYTQYGARWIELNPECTLYDFNIADLNEGLSLGVLSCNDVILDILERIGVDWSSYIEAHQLTVEAAVQLADIISYDLIHNSGGLYLNCDMEPLRSLDYLFDYYQIPNDAAWAAREDNTTARIVNAALGGPPQHPFWQYVIDELPKRYFANPTVEMVLSTGPGLLTDCVQQWRALGNDFMTLPTKSFNPIHWKDIPWGSSGIEITDPPAGVVSNHRWAHRRTGRSNLVRPNPIIGEIHKGVQMTNPEEVAPVVVDPNPPIETEVGTSVADIKELPTDVGTPSGDGVMRRKSDAGTSDCPV